MRPSRSLDTAGKVDELALRLNQLRSTSSRKWGTMTPHEMLCHLGDSFEAVLGERTASSKETWLSRTVVKWVARHTSRTWPQGVPTRPEVNPRLDGTKPVEFEPSPPPVRRVAMKSLFILLVAVVATACSAAPRPPDLAADEKAIRDLAARWQQALLARDAATQAAMFAEDGMSYHDGQEPLVGPAAILDWERKAVARHPKAKITSKTTELRIAAAGDIAIQAGEGQLTDLGENGEDHTVRRQRFVTVWRKVNGEWKVAHDIAVDTTR